ncbi:MAG: hypothetical protein ABJA67_01770 [Chthonomonadales bacterium]
MDELEKFRLNAEMVVQQMRPLSGLPFDYDAESVEWLDGFINRQRTREDLNDAKFNGIVSCAGSYVGECIIRNYGGEWRRDENGWGVFFNDTNVAYPFNKTSKQFEFGEEDSIYYFYMTIPTLFGEGSPALEGKESPLNTKPKKPRWKFL